MRRIVLLALASLAALCGATGCRVPRADPAELVAGYMAFMRNHYLIQPGDRIRVVLADSPDAPQEVAVDPMGRAALAGIGVVECAGRSIQGLKAELEQRYLKLYTAPRVEVGLIEPVEQVVYVGGEVRGRGGPIPYRPGMTLMRAVLASGSFDITAKTSAVFLLRQGADGKPLHYRIDLGKIAHEGGLDVPLLPNDAVYVQTSEAAEIGNWMEIHVRRMLPISLSGVAGAYAGSSLYAR